MAAATEEEAAYTLVDLKWGESRIRDEMVNIFALLPFKAPYRQVYFSWYRENSEAFKADGFRLVKFGSRWFVLYATPATAAALAVDARGAESWRRTFRRRCAKWSRLLQPVFDAAVADWDKGGRERAQESREKWKREHPSAAAATASPTASSASSPPPPRRRGRPPKK